MINDNLSVIIMTCDAFSDLWEGQISQLKLHWKEHPLDMFLVTDKPTDRTFSDVTVLSMGNELEWSERLHGALKLVKTDFLFFTLDDYFLIEDVPNDLLNAYMKFMIERNYDYIRLFRRRKKFTGNKIEGLSGLRELDPDSVYAINLYAGLWRKDFMYKASEAKKNAWQFEVSLKRAGVAYNAKCAVCMRKDIYPILDVVRKGKLLRKADKYFKRHKGIYNGHRAVNTFAYEFKLNIRAFGVKYAPEFLVDTVRNFMIKRGHHYYSQDA